MSDKFNSWFESHAAIGLKALFFDIDGTLIAGRRALPGAVRLIEVLRKRKLPFFLLTNDGNHSTEEKSSIMRRAGLDISPGEIVSCGDALVPFADEHRLHGRKFFIMGDLGKPCYAERAGLVSERDTEKIDECAGIIVGEGFYDWQKNICSAMNYFIRNPHAHLLVPNPDSYWPNGPKGELGIGAGGKARFICTILAEYGIELHPVYLGKPYNAIFKYAYTQLKKKFGLPANTKKQSVLMLGDSLRSDIHGAKKFGFRTGLMLTGITEPFHLKKVGRDFKPDFVFSSLE